jgi:hypothetical protein
MIKPFLKAAYDTEGTRMTYAHLQWDPDGKWLFQITQMSFWGNENALSRYSYGGALRARAKITSHFGISSSSHFWQIFKNKNLEIVHYYCAFCSSKFVKPNLNLSAKNVNLFLREP